MVAITLEHAGTVQDSLPAFESMSRGVNVRYMVLLLLHRAILIAELSGGLYRDHSGGVANVKEAPIW